MMVTAELFTVDIPALEDYLLSRGRPDSAYTLARVAAEAWLAAQADPLASPDETAVQTLLSAEGGRIRSTVRATLSRDPRFRHFRDTHGELYTLSELLPDVELPSLAQVWELLNQQPQGDTLRGLEADELLRLVWGWEDDGSDDYQLLRFALNVTLQGFHELRYVAGAGWVLEAAWQALGQRPSLLEPSVPLLEADEATTAHGGRPIPAADQLLDEERTVIAPRVKTRSGKKRRRKRKELRPPADVEAWRQERRTELSFVLEAEHYYHHWLPLSGEMQWLLPPWPSQLTLHCELDGRPTQVTAWADPEIGRLLAGRELYDALYTAGVFPGARLQLRVRDGEDVYELQPLPAPAGQLVKVYLLAPDNEGNLVTSADLEALPYEVEGEQVLVAAAPYQALPALLQQIALAEKPLFARMLGICHYWQEKQGSPLRFAVDDLLAMLEVDAPPPDEALVHWILWRYRAFERQSDGRYRFWPEQADYRRAWQTEPPPRHRPTTAAGRSGRQLSLAQLVQSFHMTADDARDGQEDGLAHAGTADAAQEAVTLLSEAPPVEAAPEQSPPEETPPAEMPPAEVPPDGTPPTAAFHDLPLSEQATIPLERPQPLPEMPPTIIWKPQNVLWALVMEDDRRREKLMAAVAAYRDHPMRPVGCFLRRTALKRVRALLAAERLVSLTLENFNNTVWQMGAVRYHGRRARIDSEQLDQLLAGLSTADVQTALQQGHLFIDGNQTWGGTMVGYGATLPLSNAEKTRLLRHVLHNLLYGPQADEERINQALTADNGLRMDSISGMLHAVYPDNHIPYHVGVVKLLQDLGVPWPVQWDRNAAIYRTYYEFAARLREELDFADLNDVDWFVMRWDRVFPDAQSAAPPVATKPLAAEPPPAVKPPSAAQPPSAAKPPPAAKPPAAQSPPPQGETAVAADEFAPIRRLLQQQLVDRVVWTAAGERAYVAAAGENGITVICGRREYRIRWDLLQRVYQVLRQRKSLVIAEVGQVAGQIPGQLTGPRRVEQAEVMMGILALLEHVAADSLPPRLRYRHPPDLNAPRLTNPRHSPFASGDSAVRQR